MSNFFVNTNFSHLSDSLGNLFAEVPNFVGIHPFGLIEFLQKGRHFMSALHFISNLLNLLIYTLWVSSFFSGSLCLLLCLASGKAEVRNSRRPSVAPSLAGFSGLCNGDWGRSFAIAPLVPLPFSPSWPPNLFLWSCSEAFCSLFWIKLLRGRASASFTKSPVIPCLISIDLKLSALDFTCPPCCSHWPWGPSWPPEDTCLPSNDPSPLIGPFSLRGLDVVIPSFGTKPPCIFSLFSLSFALSSCPVTPWGPCPTSTGPCLSLIPCPLGVCSYSDPWGPAWPCSLCSFSAFSGPCPTAVWNFSTGSGANELRPSRLAGGREGGVDFSPLKTEAGFLLGRARPIDSSAFGHQPAGGPLFCPACQALAFCPTCQPAASFPACQPAASFPACQPAAFCEPATFCPASQPTASAVLSAPGWPPADRA